MTSLRRVYYVFVSLLRMQRTEFIPRLKGKLCPLLSVF